MIYKDLNDFEKILGDLNCAYSFFLKRLTLDDLEKLEHLKENKIIVLDQKSYFDLMLILQKKNNKILIEVENKNDFNNFILENSIISNNVYIQVNDEILELKEYLKLERLLYKIVEPANGFSPFEKYVYAYNIVKNFKKYKENFDDSICSRGLYNILENDYMVCVGFSNLFGDLLDKLGINNIKLLDYIDTSYDDVKDFYKFIPQEKFTKRCGHVRNYVYIKDDKYKIDGFYIADPTWDNDLSNDYYNHLIMTDLEITGSRRYAWLDINDVNELFNIQNLDEFYKKIDFLVKRNITYVNRKGVILRLIHRISQLDPVFYEKLKIKYNYIDKLYNYSGDLIDLINYLGMYILERVNKSISFSKMMCAIEEVYKKFYGYDDELKNKLIEVKELNRQRQLICFPKRYKYFNDHRTECYDNCINKFDIK